MRIKPYGVVWDGIAGLGGAGFPICSVEVVALFSKNDKRDKLLYRPPRTPADFKDSHPKLFAKFLKNVYANFPCNSSKVETANVWGPQRARFMPLVARMATGVKEIRDRDCAAEYGGPKRRISVKDLEGYLAKHIVANNALSYLYNLGYVNFFSV